MQNPINKKIVFIISFIRVLSAFPILINPLWGFITFVIIDYFDAYFLQHFAGMGWRTYQQWDKKFDIPGFIAMTYLGFVAGLGIPFGSFFVFRMIGEIFFFVYKKQAILLFFPNFIEPYFVWVLLLKNFNLPIYWLVILFVLQILLEYFLHIFWPNYLKKNDFPKFFRAFGLTKVENWD